MGAGAMGTCHSSVIKRSTRMSHCDGGKGQHLLQSVLMLNHQRSSKDDGRPTCYMRHCCQGNFLSKLQVLQAWRGSV